MNGSWLSLPVLGHGKETFRRGVTAKVSVRPRDSFFVLESDRFRRVEPFLANDDWSLRVVIGLGFSNVSIDRIILVHLHVDKQGLD